MTISSDHDLDQIIIHRLRLVGIDLSELPDLPDPVTGTPGRDQVMEALRTFLAGPVVGGERQGGVIRTISAWRPHPDPVSATQTALPVMYPVRDR